MTMKQTIEELKAQGKKVLYLPIKQSYFDAIMDGSKVEEFRDITPKNVKRYVQLDYEGYEMEDELGDAIPVHYDYIHFAVGYSKDRDEALVEITDTYIEVAQEAMRREDDDSIILFEGEKDGKPYLYKVDENNNFVLDADGKKIPDPEGLPCMVENGGTGVPYYYPIIYQYGEDNEGNTLDWVVERAVFCLGKIINKKIKN